MIQLRKDEVERLTKELKSQRVNSTVKMNEAKVVDTCPFEDIEDCDQKVFCRCWKSSKVRCRFGRVYLCDAQYR